VGAIFGVLASLVELYVLILIARALLSWFPASPGSGLVTVVRALDRVTEPVLRPVRRILPPVRLGGMPIDLSILIVVVVAEVVVIPLLRA
jgi:YggT family protein